MVALYFSADDFGLTDGVSRGIVTGIREGVVATTSAMICVPDAARHLARWSAALPGRIGGHLQLTGGRPCLPPERVPSLVDAYGEFLPSRAAVTAAAPAPDEVYAEWNAQLARLAECGIAVTHLDSHHHVHRLPGIFDVYCTIARERCLPVRTHDRAMTQTLRRRNIRCADQCLTGFYGAKATAADLRMAVHAARARHGPDAVLEVMCHPGEVDDALAAVSKYTDGRAQELALLCAPDFRAQLESWGVELLDAPPG